MHERPANTPAPISPHIRIYRWRSPMIASLLHRISGLLLLVFALFFLFSVVSVQAETSAVFEMLQHGLQSTPGYLFLLCCGVAVIYHSVNGIRFILLDLGVGESRSSMQQSAKLSLASIVLALLLMVVWL